MTDEQVDELLADLDRALTVEPSPSVIAKVRVRVAPPSASWHGLRRAVAAVGGVAIASAAFLLWPHPSAIPSSQVTLRGSLHSVGEPEAQTGAQVTSGRRVPPARARRTDVEVRLRPSTGDAGTGSIQRVNVAVETVTPGAVDPEVLVPPDQLMAVRQFLQARSHTTAKLPRAEATFGEIAPLPTADLMEIAVLEIMPLGTSPLGGGDHQ